MIIVGCNNIRTEKLNGETDKAVALDEVVKDSVRDYLRNTLNDPNSLEEVKWGQVVSNDTTYFNLRIATIDKVIQMDKDYPNSSDPNDIMDFIKLRDSLMQAKNTSTNYAIELRYRAKNKYGGVITIDNKFWLDSSLKVFNTMR
jgi:hypothetical protein